MPKHQRIRRQVTNRVLRLACTEIQKDMLIKLQNQRPRRWVRDWVDRRGGLGASNTLLRELAEEDPPSKTTPVWEYRCRLCLPRFFLIDLFYLTHFCKSFKFLIFLFSDSSPSFTCRPAAATSWSSLLIPCSRAFLFM